MENTVRKLHLNTVDEEQTVRSTCLSSRHVAVTNDTFSPCSLLSSGMDLWLRMLPPLKKPSAMAFSLVMEAIPRVRITELGVRLEIPTRCVVAMLAFLAIIV